MDTATRTVLVAGATGYVGGRLIPALLDQGEMVRALARVPGKLDGRTFSGRDGLSVVQGDVLDADSLRHALADVDVAYYLVHSMGGGAGFAQRDLRAARTFAAACRDAGVSRIIYLSALGRRSADDLSHHLTSRHETGDALRSAGVPVTELRAALVIGSGSASYEIIRDLVHHLPIMIAPRWLRSRCEPIAIRDVVEYLVRCLDEPRTVGQSLDVGGGEVLTYQLMIQICARELGKRRRIIPVPLLTPWLSSWWMHLVTSVDFSLAQPLIEGLRNDVVCEDHRITEWIPIERTGYREAVRLAILRAREPERWSQWSDARTSTTDEAAGADGRRLRTFEDYRVFDANCSADRLFASVSNIGGTNGYGGGVDILWRIRGAFDRLVGGPGLRRGRSRGDLHDGDPLDFWRVDHIEPPEALALTAEMLVPGTARLEFRVEPLAGNRSRLHQTATFVGTSPRTALYWNAIKPAHSVVFTSLGNHIITRATRDA